MKSNHVDDNSTCGFCNSIIKKNSTTCSYCGAELITAYIDRPTRKLILYLRVALIFISGLLALFSYQISNLVYLSIILAVSLVLIAWILPWLYFKIKNRENNIWRRKSF